ncbi:MAG: glycerophosphodiester phosphodiesterase family protein [Granulosicoccaceae bacterium]
MSRATLLAPVVAHRGASADAPENTIAAIRLAAEQGATAVEIDVSISADGVAFVHHDDGLERCTNGKGYLCAHNASDLDSLSAGVLFSDYANEPLPRLSAVLECVAEHNMTLNLEIKPTPGLEEPTAQIICQTVAAHGQAGKPILYSSFSREALKTTMELQPETPRALIVCAIPENWPEQLAAYACSNFHFAAPLADKKALQALRDEGYGLYCFTVNDAEQAAKLYELGVHGVFSDYPGMLIEKLVS